MKSTVRSQPEARLEDIEENEGSLPEWNFPALGIQSRLTVKALALGRHAPQTAEKYLRLRRNRLFLGPRVGIRDNNQSSKPIDSCFDCSLVHVCIRFVLQVK